MYDNLTAKKNHHQGRRYAPPDGQILFPIVWKASTDKKYEAGLASEKIEFNTRQMCPKLKKAIKADVGISTGGAKEVAIEAENVVPVQDNPEDEPASALKVEFII